MGGSAGYYSTNDTVQILQYRYYNTSTIVQLLQYKNYSTSTTLLLRQTRIVSWSVIKYVIFIIYNVVLDNFMNQSICHVIGNLNVGQLGLCHGPSTLGKILCLPAE